MFKGVISTAGKLRTYNIRKHEWVVREDSVTYGSADTLKASLVRDFKDELDFDYGAKTAKGMIPHISRFIAQIWQVHPFCEGNTRTVAVFAIKYLRSLGHVATNNMFEKHSWYFRNALVRANYADYAKGVKRDWTYLERFFRNLLLGERNELKSRYLLIGLTEEDKQKIRMWSEKSGQKKSGQKKAVRKKRARESGQKTADRLLAMLAADFCMTQKQMAEELGINRSAIQRHISNLKNAGKLRRVGPDKGGHWEVTA